MYTCTIKKKDFVNYIINSNSLISYILVVYASRSLIWKTKILLQFVSLLYGKTKTSRIYR